MATAPKKIFIIDDDSSLSIKDLCDNIFPTAEAVDFSNLGNATQALAEIGDGHYPDLFFIDATTQPGWGASNAVSILKWFREHVPEHPLPIIIMQSAEEELARRALKWARNEVRTLDISFEGLEINKEELRFVRDILSPDRRPNIQILKYAKLPAFLNRVYAFDLPTTQVELDRILLKRERIDPEDYIRMAESGLVTRREVLEYLGPRIRQDTEQAYYPAIQHGEASRLIDYQESVSFKHATGWPVVGPAAFDAEDALRQAANGKRPILIVESADTDIVKLFKHVAAIVVFSNTGSGHLELLADAHRMPALLGREPDRWKEARVTPHYARGNKKPRLHVQHIIEASPKNMAVLVSRNTKKFEYVGPAKTDDEDISEPYPHYRTTRDIRSGDEITIDPVKRTLYTTKLWIDRPMRSQYDWLEKIGPWLTDWETQHHVKHLAFKQNIDVLEQTGDIWKSEGIGLVRTEHLILTGEALETFRSLVLQRNDAAWEDFETAQKQDFERVLEPLCNVKFTPVRMRLADAPPLEFFKEDQLSRFEALYGSLDLRGVQLAAQLPQLYETQLRAIFKAYRELGEQAKERDWRTPPSGPVEIMVPTTRTADELRFAKDTAARIADETGFPREKYRFGSMLETLEACKNIREIAPLCEFISIGSNDLTAEILGCARDDWEKRHKLTVRSGTLSDPFVTLHSRVLWHLRRTVKEARRVHPTLQVDLCGAHAADLASLIALQSLRLDGVSTPPSALNQGGLPLRYQYARFQMLKDRPARTARKASSPEPG